MCSVPGATSNYLVVLFNAQVLLKGWGKPNRGRKVGGREQAARRR